MRASRSASLTIRSASGRRHRRVVLAPRIVSASSPSAPIGVLSSWLTLATKSRRTLSIAAHLGDVVRRTRPRRADARGVADRHRRQVQHRAGRAEELQLALAALTASAPRIEQRRARRPAASAWRAVAEPLGGRVAERPRCRRRRRRARPGGARRARPGERSRCPTTVSVSLQCPGQRLLRSRRSASRRWGLMTSSEPPGDVALGAGVGRAGEDRLGHVELDEPADARALVVDLGGEERGAVGDARAACCMLWVTITIVKSRLSSSMRSSMRAVAIGSSAEHGSSIRTTSGSTASARAMHRRCC